MTEFLRAMLFLPEQASTYAVKADNLHFFVILATMIVSTAVGLTALAFFVRYRRRSDTQTTPVINPTVLVEGLFITVPLVFFLVWFYRGFTDYIELTTPPKDAMDVYVMAKQWMWKFSYPDGPNGLNVLYVPKGRPVRLLITSRDVIHSFYVPSFRIKKDALPGRYTQIWFQARQTGKFQVLCAEYCGVDHSRMRADVVVLEPAEFDEWLALERRGLAKRQDSAPVAEEAPTPGALIRQGEAVAIKAGCLKCHSTDGTPHIGPTWVDLYLREETLTTGEKVTADEGYLTESMMDPLAKVVAGFKPVMPVYQGRLSNTDTAALLEYIKSLKHEGVALERSKGPIYEPVP